MLQGGRCFIENLYNDINFELLQFPQELEPQSSQQLNTEFTSLLEEADSQSSLTASQDVTPHTSFSQRTGQRVFKKP